MSGITFVPANKTVAPGFTMSWSEEQDIFGCRLSDVSAITIDAWYLSNRDVLMEWPEDKPFRVLHDLTTNPNMMMTQQFETYVAKLLRLRPALGGKCAILMQRNFAAELVQRFVRNQRRSPMAAQVFFDLDEAVSWLRR